MLRRHPLIAYFALAYLITWGIQIPGILFAHERGIAFSNEDNFTIFTAVLRGGATYDEQLALAIFNVGQFGPAIAAFVLAGVLYGRAGVRDLLGRTFRWRAGARWYAIIFLLPILVSGLALVVALLTGGFSVGPFDPKVSWMLFPAFFLYLIVFTGLAEEPGWRGFALPHAQAQRSAYRASWIVGMGWGAWHLPFTVYSNRDEPLLIIPATAGLLFGIVGWTIVNTWIYNETRSVFLAIVLHGWNNTVQSYLVLSQDNYLGQIAFSLIPWGIAIWLSKRYGEEHLATQSRPVWWPGQGPREQRLAGPQPGPPLRA